MEGKVKNAIYQSMQSLVLPMPRILIRDTNSGEVYFAPNINDPKNSIDLYSQMLITINQDKSNPPIKVTPISLKVVYGASETTLIGETTVIFPLIAGIDKEVMVQSSIQLPQYKSIN